MNTTQCRRAGRAAMSHGCTTRFPLLACTAAMVICSTARGQVEDKDVIGHWDPPPLCDPPDEPYQWPTRAVTAIHLPSDEVLYWQFGGTTNRVWAHATGCHTRIQTSYSMFCSGHVALSNGSILIAGGRGGSQAGIKQVVIYRLGGIFGGPWDTDVAQLNHARWYPTCTTLPDGKILAISGRDENQDLVGIPEIYDPVEPDGWTDMGIWAFKEIPVYPFMFVLPDGNVFYAGSHGGGDENDGETYILDLQTEIWSASIGSTFIARYGSAVMYEPGRVLKCGGMFPPNPFGLPIAETETIDLSDPGDPGSWQIQPIMTTARQNHNLVVLADGTILAVGGETDEGNGPVAVLEAELFDPNDPISPHWTRMALMEKERTHHSTALLLPDGRVLAAGPPLDPFATAEIYSPAYLFQNGNDDADQPEIGVAPTDVTYGSLFNVILTSTSPVSVNAIDKVSFVRLGATTHGFDMDQRYVPLTFVVTGTATLEVTAPADGSIAPPGYYMLFLVSDDGAPSEMAKYVRLYDPA